FQIGPGLFGVRDKSGEYDMNAFQSVANADTVKAFEIKLAQGANTRGGQMQANKATQAIADIRNVEPCRTINPPNRFESIDNPTDLLDWVRQLQKVGQKPVGFKIVISKVSEVGALAQTMIETNQFPNFITIDGG